MTTSQLRTRRSKDQPAAVVDTGLAAVAERAEIAERGGLAPPPPPPPVAVCPLVWRKSVVSNQVSEGGLSTPVFLNSNPIQPGISDIVWLPGGDRPSADGHVELLSLSARVSPSRSPRRAEKPQRILRCPPEGRHRRWPVTDGHHAADEPIPRAQCTVTRPKRESSARVVVAGIRAQSVPVAYAQRLQRNLQLSEPEASRGM